jgi:hypothetical protein
MEEPIQVVADISLADDAADLLVTKRPLFVREGRIMTGEATVERIHLSLPRVTAYVQALPLSKEKWVLSCTVKNTGFVPAQVSEVTFTGNYETPQRVPGDMIDAPRLASGFGFVAAYSKKGPHVIPSGGTMDFSLPDRWLPKVLSLANSLSADKFRVEIRLDDHRVHYQVDGQTVWEQLERMTPDGELP